MTALCTAWQVTVIDPGWGRNDRLWPVLRGALATGADPRDARDPVTALNALGAVWSPDFGAYASGQLDASQIRCVLCGHAPCDCPPFGTAAYFALIDRPPRPHRGGNA